MSQAPRVSVILPSYNHELYIKRSVNSILSQTFSDFEVVILDDCSTDSSWEIIQSLAAHDGRIHAFRNEKNMFCGAIEAAMDNARGDLIAIAHSDDAWAPTKLEKQVAYLDAHPDVAACFTRVTVIDDDDNSLADDPAYAEHPYLNAFNHENRSRTDWLRFFFFNGNALCHPSVIVRRHCYKDYGLFPHGLGSLPDFQEWIRVCKHSSLFIIDEPLTYFRVHKDESNTSGQNREALFRHNIEKFLILGEYLDLSQKDLLDAFPEAEQYLVNGEINLTFALARLCIDYVGSPEYCLFAFEQLYRLMQNPTDRAQLKRLYSYSDREYDAEKKRIDIFGSVKPEKICHPKLYWDCGNGFNEFDSSQQVSYIPPSGKVSVRFSVPSPVEALRFDPDDGQIREVRIVAAAVDGKPLDLKTVNGHELNDGMTLFFTTDPQFVAPYSGVANQVDIEFEIEPLDPVRVSAITGDAVDELNQLRNEVKRLQDMLDNPIEACANKLLHRR